MILGLKVIFPLRVPFLSLLYSQFFSLLHTTREQTRGYKNSSMKPPKNRFRNPSPKSSSSSRFTSDELVQVLLDAKFDLTSKKEPLLIGCSMWPLPRVNRFLKKRERRELLWVPFFCLVCSSYLCSCC